MSTAYVSPNFLGSKCKIVSPVCIALVLFEKHVLLVHSFKVRGVMKALKACPRHFFQGLVAPCQSLCFYGVRNSATSVLLSIFCIVFTIGAIFISQIKLWLSGWLSFWTVDRHSLKFIIIYFSNTVLTLSISFFCTVNWLESEHSTFSCGCTYV